ncbi:hypothetical protein GCM10009789_77920 [Kribbella sancticallisti]|uniref:Restriction endonuclease type IV Mrr domain-containing protein n=1 Tax=Kribbella sancticallisti TaxID=460087 RepID=A0ABN2ENH0_9ACTN
MANKRISTNAYQALRDALPVIYWYKNSFNSYLRTALRQHPELLIGLNFEATKREVSDELVDRLMRDENIYQEATLRLMMEIANMSSFPELNRHEDAESLVVKAEAAVTELREQTKVHEQLIIERERLDAERSAYIQQAEVQRRFADELTDMKDRFFGLSSASGDPQQRGRDFEGFLNDLFRLFDLEPRLSYNIPNQQIDGSFHFDTDDYVVEAKWTTDRVNTKDANHFASKVRTKGKNALGLMVSVNGFTEDALSDYSRATVFMTLDGLDLLAVLEDRIRLDEVLRRKKRHANETGECYYPVSQF